MSAPQKKENNGKEVWIETAKMPCATPTGEDQSATSGRGIAGKTAEEMDEERQQNVAYEYLCHLEEAKNW